MKLSVWSVWIPLTCQKISVTARLGPEQREAERSQGKPAARAGVLWRQSGSGYSRARIDNTWWLTEERRKDVVDGRRTLAPMAWANWWRGCSGSCRQTGDRFGGRPSESADGKLELLMNLQLRRQKWIRNKCLRWTAGGQWICESVDKEITHWD